MKTHRVLHRYTNACLWESDCETLRESVEAAVKGGAYLRGAYLDGAYLDGANLDGANLGGANLRGAYLRGAYLDGAYLGDWRSHDLIAEILRSAAGAEVEKRKIAGLVLVSRDWCWTEFLGLIASEPLGAWAVDTLAPFVQDNDGAPAILRRRHDELKAEAKAGEVAR